MRATAPSKNKPTVPPGHLPFVQGVRGDGSVVRWWEEVTLP
jgi:hypothetical protein